MLYSLVETAKANLVNTYQYFEHILIVIPKRMDDTDLSFLDDRKSSVTSTCLS